MAHSVTSLDSCSEGKSTFSTSGSVVLQPQEFEGEWWEDTGGACATVLFHKCSSACFLKTGHVRIIQCQSGYESSASVAAMAVMGSRLLCTWTDADTWHTGSLSTSIVCFDKSLVLLDLAFIPYATKKSVVSNWRSGCKWPSKDDPLLRLSNEIQTHVAVQIQLVQIQS